MSTRLVVLAPSKAHSTRAELFVANDERMHWHDKALWFVRQKRDKAAASVPEWERLRELASQIKTHTLIQLPEYLEAFETKARALGAEVHWAKDAAEHNAIVLGILEAAGAKRVVKSKSMLTEECHLNPFLEARGYDVVDTDLGERIVQFRNEAPSHIVLPAIHIRKEEVGDTFHQHLGTEAGASDPQYLTEAARGHLRTKFMEADVGITGVNFAIAETGAFVVCTNEGNADLGTALPKIHIACMGIEKLLPRTRDLAVFLRLLARSATGQPITTYSSHFFGPRPQGKLHIILLDNGRSGISQSPEFKSSLHCIRCGACMNTCPVYRRSGGHSYGTTVPGPIGSILAPARDPQAFQSLPYACSLCGSCTDVCPVKINLHEQLLLMRNEVTLKGYLPRLKQLSMTLASFVFQRPRLYAFLGALGRGFGRLLPKRWVNNRLNGWGRQRDLPPLPAQSFRALYRNRKPPR